MNPFAPSSYLFRKRIHNRRYFYKYTSAETAESIIRGRSLRWSSPILFNQKNDPLDSSPTLPLSFDEPELAGSIKQDVAVLIESGSAISINHPLMKVMGSILDGMDHDDRHACADYIRRQSSIPTTGQVESFDDFKKYWRDEVPNLRILCLAESENMDRMWEDYADHKRGIVLQFEAREDVDSPLLLAQRVIYQDEPPSIACVRSWVNAIVRERRSMFELLTEYQYVKRTQFAHEQEWRIVTRKRPNDMGLFQDYELHPLEISGVCFGSKCSQEDQRAIQALLCGDLQHVNRIGASH